MISSGIRRTPAIAARDQASAQVGVAPALQQLHRLAQPFRARLVALPALRLAWIAEQPLQHWVAGVVLLEQRQAMAALLALARQSLMACRPVDHRGAGSFRRPIASPNSGEHPPVRPALAGPMQAFIEPAHRWGEGIRCRLLSLPSSWVSPW